MANATLRKIVTGYAAQDPAIIDSLVNASGILETANFQPANHNVYHISKKGDSVISGDFISPGGSVTDSSTDDNIVQTDLKLARILKSEPKEIVESYPGGKGAFWKNQEPLTMEGMAQTIAKQLIYGVDSTFGNVMGFRGFHQIAKSNSKVIQAGGATGQRTSIFAVRWQNDLCSILFNSAMMSQGQFVKTDVLHGGKPTTEVTNTTTGAKKLVYQVAYDSYLSLLAPDSKNVAAYTQIQDADNDRPTASNMDYLVDLVNGSSSDTIIYCNRTGRRLLWMLKNSKMQTIPSDNNYRDSFELWNGIRVALDENISGVETTVLD